MWPRRKKNKGEETQKSQQKEERQNKIQADLMEWKSERALEVGGLGCPARGGGRKGVAFSTAQPHLCLDLIPPPLPPTPALPLSGSISSAHALSANLKNVA